MKCENISDAIGLLDESMIAHALVIRGKKKKERSNRNRIWKIQYVAAVSFCLICAGAAAIWFVFSYGSGDDPVQEKFLLNEQTVQVAPEIEVPERFVEVSSLLASGNGNFIVEQAQKYTIVPIEEYNGIYTEVTSVNPSVLSESIGKSIDGVGEWYYISGHSDRQYLIRNDEQGVSLWKFQCFDSSEYPYNDVLKLVYQISSADAITEIEVTPAMMDNSDGGRKIQEEIGVRKITDSTAIETVYEVLSGMTCYGSNRWDMIDYGDVEAASDADTQSHEALRLGRYLSITTDYGNVIDGLKYTAVSDMFYEFSGIAYNTLADEQAAGICEIIGITKSGEENGPETDNAFWQEDKSNDTEKTFLSQAANTDVSLEYVTELQSKVSNAMINHELPFVISSSVYENPYRLHVVVTSDSEDDLQKLRDLDSVGGVLEIEYSAVGINALQEWKN